MSSLAEHGPSTWLKRFSRCRAWLIVALVVLFSAAVRFHLRDMPLERDEGEYAYAGQLILQGIPPYKQVYNMKLPGTYVAYALIMAVFGQSPSGIHFGLLLLNSASIVLVFLIGRRLLDQTTGVVAATAYGLLSMSPSVLGLAAHATHFVTFFALAGIWVLLKGLPPFQRPSVSALAPKLTIRLSRFTFGVSPLFASGVLFGLAFVMKQHGIFFGLFGILYILSYHLSRWVELRQEDRKERRTGGRSAVEPQAEKKSISTLPPGLTPAPAPRRVSHFAAGKQKLAVPQPAPGASIPVVSESAPSLKPPASIPAPAAKEKAPPQPMKTPATVEPRVKPVDSRPLAMTAFPALLRDGALLISGLAVPYFLSCLVLLLAGVFDQFWFWTVSYAREYAAAIPLVNAPEFLRSGVRTVVGPNWAFWVLPWIGAVMMWWDERLSLRARFLFMALLFCCFASTALGLYFRGHYFITFLPALASLSGIAISRSLHVLQHQRSLELFVAVPVLIVFGIGIGWALVGNGAAWFATTPEKALNEVYGSTLFADARKVGAFIRTNSTPESRIAVVGSEPEIYFYSQRLSATGYIYSYPLMESQPYARTMQEKMIREIEEARPEFVIYVDDDFSWLRQPDSPNFLDRWWSNYRGTQLELIQTATIREEREKLEFYQKPGPAGQAGAARPAKYILVYRRRM